MVATTRVAQPLKDTAPAVFVSYLSKTNPWSQSMREVLSCLPRFFRRGDCIFLEVMFEDMTYTEQMHHRLGALPAFKIYTRVSTLILIPLYALGAPHAYATLLLALIAT